MPSSEDIRVHRSTSLDDLTEASKKINSATKRLTAAVDQLNESLKRLNFGVPVWTVVCTGEPTHQIVETEELGYAKVKGIWGVSIRQTIEGLGSGPEEREWHFQDAPRDLRIRAAACFSKLLSDLHAESLKTAQLMEERATDVEEMSFAITEAADKATGRATLKQQVLEAK